MAPEVQELDKEETLLQVVQQQDGLEEELQLLLEVLVKVPEETVFLAQLVQVSAKEETLHPLLQEGCLEEFQPLSEVLAKVREETVF